MKTSAAVSIIVKDEGDGDIDNSYNNTEMSGCVGNAY